MVEAFASKGGGAEREREREEERGRPLKENRRDRESETYGEQTHNQLSWATMIATYLSERGRKGHGHISQVLHPCRIKDTRVIISMFINEDKFRSNPKN